ncbi:hypothetical protein [Nakamurella leprariae]|uniref:Uncharacterized protein n=1 Tax=Nakamurella leprariae TaxID=2803911 RepID=A0A938YIK2_9ACTN|nr:hypothetical protein [Nakamurella leprariae]MBM9468440.1 hypothetical protein [Nakamurella leprariae]
MIAPAVLRQAVENNAVWCDHVCRLAGVATTWRADAWTARPRTPTGYPDAVTREPDVDAEALLSRIDAGPGCSVKDGFATLDLSAHGFRVLFDAEWIHLPAPAGSRRAGHRGGVRRFEVDGGSVMASLSGTVVGLSNLVLTGADATVVWLRAVRAVADAFPGRDLVGYERPEDLSPARAAGFRLIGPLRVWWRGTPPTAGWGDLRWSAAR